MYVKSELLYSRLLIYFGLINIGRFVILEGHAGHVGAVVIGLVLLPLLLLRRIGLQWSWRSHRGKVSGKCLINVRAVAHWMMLSRSLSGHHCRWLGVEIDVVVLHYHGLRQGDRYGW